MNLGFITNPQWFLNLSRSRLHTYLHELMDIWNYRAQLTQETKRKVEPQRGNPFYNFNIPLILTKEKEQIQKKITNYRNIYYTRRNTRRQVFRGLLCTRSTYYGIFECCKFITMVV